MSPKPLNTVLDPTFLVKYEVGPTRQAERDVIAAAEKWFEVGTAAGDVSLEDVTLHNAVAKLREARGK